MYARIFTLITSLGIGIFTVYISFSLGQAKIAVEVKQNTVFETVLENDKITMTPVVNSNDSPKPKQEYFKELDILSFVFFQPHVEEKIDSSFSYSTGQITLKKGSYIFGLYNPFLKYNIYSEFFHVEQVTNGSVYFDTEQDGTISVYSLDAVVRLHFLSSGKPMTNMLLLPGNYIRFDPNNNSYLNSVDLFQVISLLDGSNQTFEYVNPKLDGGTILANYRFSNKNQLIRLFHKFFQEKVNNVNEIKQKYQDTNTFSGVVNSPLFQNPAKRSHYLLLNLGAELTKIVRMVNLNPTVVSAKISEIYKNAYSAGVELSVKGMLEQFIVDGRFAIYGDKFDANFEPIYFDIASKIGITATSQRSKKLQELSNIYAKNIAASVNIKGIKGLSRADVYQATSTILSNILEAGNLDMGDKLEAKDFFDIAIYSYNILLKSETQGRYTDEYILNINTHRYLATFFKASHLYYDKLEDKAKRKSIIKILAVEYFRHLFTALSNGVVQTFTEKDSDGEYIFLRPRYKNGDDLRLNIDKTILSAIREHIDTGKELVNLLTEDSVFKDDTSIASAVSKIKESILILENFLLMVDDYRQYVKTPKKSLLEEINKVSLDTSSQIASTQQTGSSLDPISPPEPIALDPLSILKKTFPSLSDSNMQMGTGGAYSIQKVPFSITSTDGIRYNTLFSAIYNIDNKNITNIVIQLENYTIKVTPAKLTFGVFNRYMLFLGDYLQKIKNLGDEGMLGSGEIRIALGENKIYVDDAVYPIREEE